MLATEVRVIAQLLVIVHALPGHNVLPYQPRFLAPSKFRGAASIGVFPGQQGWE